MSILNVSSIQKSLGISENCEVAQIYLTKDIRYIFTLTIPQESNYDMYLFYLNNGKLGLINDALISSNSTLK